MTTGMTTGRTTGPGRAVTRWSLRQVRRGALILVLSVAGYLALEVASYNATYPHGIDPDQMKIFLDNPASRMLQGVPRGLHTTAGFAVWDAGWLLLIILGVWALLVVTRLLRGEEDTTRAELLLVGPLRGSTVTGLSLLVVVAVAVAAGLATTLSLVASGAGTSGSVWFGLGVTGFACTFAGVAAVTSQLVDVRRRAAGLAAAVLGVAFALRMVANSTDDRQWVGWLTPFGWIDQLQAFGDPLLVALVPLLVTPVLLLVVAVLLRGTRDTGGALLASDDTREPRLRGLGGQAAFAWRSNQAVLLAWALGLAAYGFILGALLNSSIDFIESDADYRRILERMGLDVALTAEGFLGFMSSTLGVAFAMYAAWRIGAVRNEEEAGRADNLLTRTLTRSRWLVTHTLLTVACSALLAAVTGTALWAGAHASGARDVSLLDCLRSVGNTGSVVLLVIGVAVLTFGLAPRLTVAVAAAVTVGGYILALLGPPLSWPDWVVDLSPFSHLAFVPAEPFAARPAAVLVLLALAAAAAGVSAFDHRDLQGA